MTWLLGKLKQIWLFSQPHFKWCIPQKIKRFCVAYKVDSSSTPVRVFKCLEVMLIGLLLFVFMKYYASMNIFVASVFQKVPTFHPTRCWSLFADVIVGLKTTPGFKSPIANHCAVLGKNGYFQFDAVTFTFYVVWVPGFETWHKKA